MEQSQNKGINKLLEALKEAGLPHDRKWVWRQIKAGRLSLPKIPHAPRMYNLTDEVISLAVEGLKRQGEFHWRVD